MSEKQIWSRKSTFILAAAGSAIGLGNVWKFPYMVGENGGGAFVLIYLACIIIIGLPLMMSETLIGKSAHDNPAFAIQRAAKASGGSTNWKVIAYIGMFCLFLLFSFYSVIAGWALDYTVNFGLGRFTDKPAEQVAAMFDNLLASPSRLVVWHAAATILTASVVIAGVRKGIEKALSVMMPLMIALLVGMLIYSMTQTGKFAEGWTYMFHWSPEKITSQTWISALGHAFFSLSLGMTVIMAYAAYMRDDVSVTYSAGWVTFMDTIIALMAGLVIFPIVFAHGLEAGEGPGLIFVTLSSAFANMGVLGTVLGTTFFFLLSLAAISSAISMVEPVVKWSVDRFNVNRTFITIAYCSLTWAFGLVTVFSFNIWSKVYLLGDGKTPFDLIDYLSSSILLPMGGLLVAIFVGWVVSKEVSREALPELPSWAFEIWHALVKFVAPVLIGLIFYSVLS